MKSKKRICKTCRFFDVEPYDDGGKRNMGKVADPLRKYAEDIPGGLGGDALRHIADQIDCDHEQRMRQCELEVRRKLCRDIRWAVNMFEHESSRRQVRKEDECRE